MNKPSVKSKRILFLLGFLVLVFYFPFGLKAAQSLGPVTLQSVTPRIITPNGDGKNDVAFFNFGSSDHLTGLPITGDVFSITGARVANFGVSNINDTKMSWNGKDGDGNTLPSGIYIYQIKLGDSRLTGTVVIAR